MDPAEGAVDPNEGQEWSNSSGGSLPDPNDSSPAGVPLPRVTEEQGNMGRKASKKFAEGQHAECLEIVDNLAAQRPDDPRIIANSAVCKFFVRTNDTARVDDLAAGLQAAYVRIVEMNGGEFEADQEVEYSVLVYNIALYTMHRKNYAVAEKLASKLYNMIVSGAGQTSSPRSTPTLTVQPSSGDVAFAKDKVLPLLISLSLRLRMSGQALALLTAAEARAKQGQDDDNLHFITLCRALALAQTRQHKVFKRDVKSHGLSPKRAIAFEFIRAYLEFVKGNHRKAQKLLGMAMSAASSKAELGKADLAYASSLHLNNLGVIHLMMRKPNLAVYYTNAALAEHDAALEGLSVADPAAALRIKKPEIAYNMAMALLHAGQPAEAFQAFLHTAAIFRSSANYWLRLAECCINCLRSDDHVASKLYTSATWTMSNTVAKKRLNGEAKHAPIALEGALAGRPNIVPALTHEYGLFCLENAEILLLAAGSTQKSPEKMPVATASSPSSSTTSAQTSPVKNYLSSESRSQIMLAALWTNQAYVNLCLGKFEAALEASGKVLASETASLAPGYAVLAQTYSAEALAGLARYSEAMAHVDPARAKFFAMNFAEPTATANATAGNNNGAADWKGEPAATIFSANLAVAMILRGDLDKAGDVLDRIGDEAAERSGLSAKILSLRVYVALSRDNVEKARTLAGNHTLTSAM